MIRRCGTPRIALDQIPFGTFVSGSGKSGSGGSDNGRGQLLNANQLLPFLLTVAVIEFTPGPNMGYLAVVAGRSGWRAGVAVVAGVTLGLAIYLAASVFGLAEASLRWPWIYETLRWAGVAYMLWLAVDTWRSVDGAETPYLESSGLFLRGLLNNLLNPKAAVFYIAVLPGFVRAQTGHPEWQALSLGAIHIAVSVGVHLAIVWTASRAREALASGETATRSRVLPRAFALALAAMAVWLAVSPGR